MPGKASLRAGQYYAHRQNSFWRIVGELCQFDPTAPYEVRTRGLLGARIAVWDVLQSCRRASSLDSDIEEASIVVNRFDAFFHRHPKIGLICFNGSKAEQSYRKYVLPELAVAEGLEYRRLPSTSPAHASLGYAAKLAAWRVMLSPPTVREARQLQQA
jgi:hypoxanthine-DNA glycosylase